MQGSQRAWTQIKQTNRLTVWKKTKMFSTKQIVCYLPTDSLAVKKEFSWLKNCCSSLSASMSATCKSLWNFEQRKNKKSGSTTPFFLVVTGELSRKLYLCCKLESVNKIVLWGLISYPYWETKNKFCINQQNWNFLLKVHCKWL